MLLGNYFIVLVLILVAGLLIIWIKKDSEKEFELPTKSRQKSWQEWDTTLVLYVAKYGTEEINCTILDIANFMDRSVGALEAKIDRLQRPHTSGDTSSLSKRIIEEWSTKSEFELQEHALKIITSILAGKAEGISE